MAGAEDILKPGLKLQELFRTLAERGLRPEAVGCEEEWISKWIEQHRHPGGPFEVDLLSGQRIEIHVYRTSEGGTVTVRTDISERKRVEQDLRESEERYRETVEGIEDLITIVDKDGRFKFVNHMAHSIIGMAPESCIGLHAYDFTHPDDRDKTTEAYQDWIKNKKTTVVYENRQINEDGSVHHMAWNISIHYGDDGEVTTLNGIGRDITERKTLQEQLAQSQKMEVVGQLTGGVAHDFNNLMNVILGNLELAEGAKTDDERNRLLSNAKNAVDRGAALTQQLLSFSCQQTLSPKIIYANDLISDSLRLIERTLGENIEIETLLSEQPLPVKIDTAMFGNALLNLALNARDAMPKGGRLTITTTKVELRGEMEGEDNEPLVGPYVWIMISDTGHGIDKKNLERVIDPFFTTKEVGEGSGLGLSMVYGFIQQSGGYLKIYSARNKGTIVSLYVPVTDEKPEQDAGLEDSYKPISQARTILVVEDDPDVLNTTSRLLTDLGYEVLEGADGPSAKDMLEEKSNTIDMVFSDVVMPKGMSGIELAEWVRDEYKHIKVLLTSGYPDIASNSSAQPDGVKLLAKPYKRAQLAKAIDDAFFR